MKLRLEIRRPKELKAFNSLRLPVEDTVEAAAEVLIKLAGEIKLVRTEPEAQVKTQQLKARVEIQQLKELKVLLIVVYY